jgi:hypothetical protein
MFGTHDQKVRVVAVFIAVSMSAWLTCGTLGVAATEAAGVAAVEAAAVGVAAGVAVGVLAGVGVVALLLQAAARIATASRRGPSLGARARVAALWNTSSTPCFVRVVAQIGDACPC